MSMAQSVTEKATAALGQAQQAISGVNFGTLAIGAAGLFGTLGAGVAAFVKFNSDLGETSKQAKAAALDLDNFQKLQFAAGSQGLSNSDFASGAAKMATNLNDATRGANDLSKLLDANNVKFKDANGLLVNTNQMFDIARGLIANGANEFDKIKIADMLGLTKEWVPVLDQSAAAWTASKNEATALGLVIDSSTIEKAAVFTQEWQKAGMVFSTWIKAQIADLLPALDDLIAKAKEFESSIAAALSNKGQSASSGASNATPNTADAQANDAAFNARVNAMLAAADGDKSMLENWKALWDALTGKVNENTKAIQSNEAAAVASAAAPKAFDEGAAMSANLAGGIGGYPLAHTNVPGKDAAKEAKDAWDSAVDSVQKHIAVLAADDLAVGQSTAATDQLKAEFQLLEGARRADKGVTDDQIAAYTVARASMTADQALRQAGIKLGSEEQESFDKTTAAILKQSQANAEAKIQNDINFKTNTAFLSPEDAQIAAQLKTTIPDVTTALNSSQAAAMRMNNAMSTVSTTIQGDLSTAMVDIMTHTKATGDVWRSFGLQVITAIDQMIVKMLIMGPIMRALQESMSGAGGGFNFLNMFGIGGAGGGAGTMGGTGGGLGGLYANGGVFDNGRVIHPYALGGITSDILVAPTLFPMANGAGLAGEAGPEAIMPLKRGSDGRLGISGAGGGATTVHINQGDIHIDASGADPAVVARLQSTLTQFRKSQYSDTMKIINDASGRGWRPRV